MEDKEKQTKSLRLTLNYPTVEGKVIETELTVKFSNPKFNKKYSVSDGSYKEYAKTYDMEFVLEIPDFIYDELKGKSVGERKLGESPNGASRTYEENFPKNIKRRSIDALSEAWYQIVLDYAWLRKIERAELKKVIFYKFDNSSGDTTSEWNGNPIGSESILHYKFALGYVKKSGKDVIRLNSDKKMMNSRFDIDFYEYKFISWTQEREDFFRGLNDVFEKQIAAMANFEKNLTEEKINSFIQNKEGLLSLQPHKK